MLEAGLVALLKADTGVQALCGVRGGSLAILPKGALLPNWCYFLVSGSPTYTLTHKDGLTKVRVQIDCHGDTGEQAIGLAHAIDKVLDFYSGTLTDADATRIFGVESANKGIDFFDDAARTYRRVIEYVIWYGAK